MIHIIIYISYIYCIYFLNKTLYSTIWKNIIKNITMAKTNFNYYIDKKPKPKYRGILHGITTYIISILLIYSFYYNKNQEVFLFLIGKFCIYFISAIYHLYPFKSENNLNTIHNIDLIIIPLSIHSGITVYANKYGLGLYNELYIAIGLVCINIILIAIQKIYHKNTKHTVSIIRHSIIALYSIYVFYISGKSVKYNILWMLMLTVYTIAFYCGTLVDNTNLNVPVIEPIYFPHHIKNIWSTHEDMHFLILVADILKAILSLQFYNSNLFIMN